MAETLDVIDEQDMLPVLEVRVLDAHMQKNELSSPTAITISYG